jgi:hypothetical protein
MGVALKPPGTSSRSWRLEWGTISSAQTACLVCYRDFLPIGEEQEEEYPGSQGQGMTYSLLCSCSWDHCGWGNYSSQILLQELCQSWECFPVGYCKIGIEI